MLTLILAADFTIVHTLVKLRITQCYVILAVDKPGWHPRSSFSLEWHVTSRMPQNVLKSLSYVERGNPEIYKETQWTGTFNNTCVIFTSSRRSQIWQLVDIFHANSIEVVTGICTTTSYSSLFYPFPFPFPFPYASPSLHSPLWNFVFPSVVKSWLKIAIWKIILFEYFYTYTEDNNASSYELRI